MNDDFDYEQGIENIKRFFRKLRSRPLADKGTPYDSLGESGDVFVNLPRLEDLCSPVIAVPVKKNERRLNSV